MADRTDIPVVNVTWNPLTGCSPVSQGCRRCYARGFAKRLAGRYGYPVNEPFRPLLHKGRLGQPQSWKTPRNIFVCSMGDIFHKEHPRDAVDLVFQAMASAPWHMYTVLTKRPEIMAEYLAYMRARNPERFAALTPRLWLGVSVENQAMAEERLPLLLEHWPGVRVACCEPLLEKVNLSSWIRALGWVITGGETGPGGQEADPEHVRFLRDQCLEEGVPLYFKQWGGRNNKHTPNILDGRAWEQLPPESVMRRK